MPRRLTDEERAWREFAEKEVQANFMVEARKLGWDVWHFHDSRKMVRRGNRFIPVADPDAAGFPDLVLAHHRWGVVFIEVKKELKDLEPKQVLARNALLQAGAKWFLLKPSSFDHLAQGLAKGFENI